jgi:thiol-disulfide isomerase/thioredoxin
MATPSRAQQPPSVDSVLAEAFRLAGQQQKNVFILFHASWCGWCHRMDKAMADTSCREYFENSYVIRHLVVDESPEKRALEHPGVYEFRRRYGGEGQGIPFWLVFDAKGALLADSRMPNADGSPGNNCGCPADGEEVSYFVRIVQKTSRLTNEALEAIRQRFLKNKY